MPKRCRGLKPTRGQRNTDKSEINSDIRPSFAGRKSKQTQTHHARTIQLGFGNSGPGVTQPKKGKKGTIRTHSQPSQPVERNSCGIKTMVDQEDHAEGTSENQVNEELHPTFWRRCWGGDLIW